MLECDVAFFVHDKDSDGVLQDDEIISYVTDVMFGEKSQPLDQTQKLASELSSQCSSTELIWTQEDADCICEALIA